MDFCSTECTRNFISYSKSFLIFGTLRLFTMTTNLFVIANVKQLRTGGSFRILLPFFRTSWGAGVLNSAIFNSFHNRVEFGTILEGPRNFGRGGLTAPKPPCPLGTPLSRLSLLTFDYPCSDAPPVHYWERSASILPLISTVKVHVDKIPAVMKIRMT